jgi:hypothetical protein
MSTFQLLINGAVGFLLPVIVGIVTRWSTRSAVKAVVLLFLSALSGLLTAWLANPSMHFGLAALYAGEAWVVAVATHFGLWKPGGVTVTRP